MTRKYLLYGYILGVLTQTTALDQLFLTHTKQLLLVISCDTLAGIEVSFLADGTGRTEPRTDGWTDKRGSRNSYLDT